MRRSVCLSTISFISKKESEFYMHTEDQPSIAESHRGAEKLTSPRTVVVIPNFNGLRFLPDCMTALDRQTVSAFHILVIENGSTDGSVEWLRSWSLKDPQMRHVIFNETNLGFDGAVNQGIHWAEQHLLPFVLLLNNDTKARPEFIRALEGRMDQDPEHRIFALSSQMIKMHDNSIIDDAGDQYNLLGWQFQRGLDEPVSAWQKPARVFSACAGAAMYRTEAFKTVGLFDENHFAYLEDIDISFRANLYGYEIWYCPEAVCEHVGSGTSGSKYNHFKVKLSARNSIWLIYKNMPAFLMILNSFPLISGILIKQLYFTRLGYGRDYLLGLWEGLRRLPDLRRAKLEEVPPMRYLLIEMRLITATFEYISKLIRKYSQKKHG